MGVKCKRFERGQMTIELAIAIPVLIIVAVIAVNALTFFVQCAEFDRVTHEAVRTYAVSPSYGQGIDQSCTQIEQAIRDAIDESNIDIQVNYGGAGFDFNSFTATLEYHPTLFGLGLRSEVFGVALPTLSHTTSYVVDVYKPGLIV